MTDPIRDDAEFAEVLERVNAGCDELEAAVERRRDDANRWRRCACAHFGVSHHAGGCSGLYSWRPGPCGCPEFAEPTEAERIAMELIDGGRNR